jgi:uncharacterized protein
MKTTKHTGTPLTFKVSKLWTSPEGSTEKISLNVKTQFDPAEIDAVSELTGDLMLIKLKDEISALISDACITVQFTCDKCLKKFTKEVCIPNAERQFLATKPPKVEDVNDLFVIDMKNLTIDLTEMMRQEIILHFPFIQVCSKHCKGICQTCGADRNKKPCGCKDQSPENKPFANLKKIIRKS